MRRFPIVFATLSLFTIHLSPCWSQMIVAHRGASHDAPENTLAAFKLAWQQQSDGIEGDFYLTADQQIVCIHDPDTERTAGTKRMVEQVNAEPASRARVWQLERSEVAGRTNSQRSSKFGKRFPTENCSSLSSSRNNRSRRSWRAELKRLDTGRIKS